MSKSNNKKKERKYYTQQRKIKIEIQSSLK